MLDRRLFRTLISYPEHQRSKRSGDVMAVVDGIGGSDIDQILGLVNI